VTDDVSPVVRVVDDDVFFLEAVSRLLRAAGYKVRSFPGADQFLRELTDTPGCVVADLQMPGLSGLGLQDALRRAEYMLPVVFLSGKGDIPTTVLAMRDGAEDFLTKQAPKEKLLAAVDRALAHDHRLRADRARLDGLRARFRSLTPREREVLSHVVQGRLNKQIAADLGIHERTVKLHRTAITKKVRVQSVAELTRLVQEAGAFENRSPDLP